MKDELGGKIMIKFAPLIAKNSSYLIDEKSEDKKEKFIIKIKLTSKNYKSCLEATEPDNKINYLEKNKIDINSINENIKRFVKNNKSILKTRQRFKSQRHNVFTEEINKNALGSNHDKRVKSIDWMETYAYGTNKDLVSDKV